MINGATDNHGEADASFTSTTTNTSLSEICADLHTRVSLFLSTPPKDEVTGRTQEQVRISIGVVKKALEDYGYVLERLPRRSNSQVHSSFPHLSISYNGGKDCLVLLILYLSVLHTHFTQPVSRRKDGDSSTFPTSIPSIYAKPPDPFPAVTRFVSQSTKTYHLDLTHIPTLGKPSHSHPLAINNQINQPKAAFTFPGAFAYYLSLTSTSTSKGITAIFVGTRRTDPHGHHLTHFDPTDKNWPAFMRIHPVIDWHLSEIWTFLRADELRDPRTGQRLEYCSMYDEGYTSLGGVGDTLKNPKLRYLDKDGSVGYRPAYELTEDDEERLGRE
jgi:FAD synthetase